MRKVCLFLVVIGLMLGVMGCGNNELKGDCKCTIALLNVPKEMEMLDENLLEQFEISVRLENIYSEKMIDVKLTAENQFCEELKLQPGTYLVNDYYATPNNLVPVEVEIKRDKIELTRDDPQEINVVIVNKDEFADWAWSCEAGREVLEENAFSHKIQFEGQLIDVMQIVDYVEFEYEDEVPGYDKITLSNEEKGVTIVVRNTDEDPQDWQDCELVKVSFRKNNVIWGQGAFVGMDVKEAIHVEEGLYGEPDKMSGTILAGLGYDHTCVSYIDKMSGDKLTLEIVPDGDYIVSISYEPKVFE